MHDQELGSVVLRARGLRKDYGKGEGSFAPSPTSTCKSPAVRPSP